MMAHTKALENSLDQANAPAATAATTTAALHAANNVLEACEEILHAHNVVLHRLRSLVFELARRSLSCTDAVVPETLHERSMATAAIARKCLRDMNSSCGYALGTDCHVCGLLADAKVALGHLEDGLGVKTTEAPPQERRERKAA